MNKETLEQIKSAFLKDPEYVASMVGLSKYKEVCQWSFTAAIAWLVGAVEKLMESNGIKPHEYDGTPMTKYQAYEVARYRGQKVYYDGQDLGEYCKWDSEEGCIVNESGHPVLLVCDTYHVWKEPKETFDGKEAFRRLCSGKRICICFTNDWYEQSKAGEVLYQGKTRLCGVAAANLFMRHGIEKDVTWQEYTDEM